jgi:hypothetical protein
MVDQHYFALFLVEFFLVRHVAILEKLILDHVDYAIFRSSNLSHLIAKSLEEAADVDVSKPAAKRNIFSDIFNFVGGLFSQLLPKVDDKKVELVTKTVESATKRAEAVTNKAAVVAKKVDTVTKKMETITKKANGRRRAGEDYQFLDDFPEAHKRSFSVKIYFNLNRFFIFY